MANKGKRIRNAYDRIDRDGFYDIADAVKLIKECASAKFDETIELSMNLGIDPRHADQMVRGMVSLPKGTGKSVRVAVFAKGDKAKESKNKDLVMKECSKQFLTKISPKYIFSIEIKKKKFFFVTKIFQKISNFFKI